MRVIIKFIFKIIAEFLYRPKIIGKENLPKNTAALLCPNHVHALDSAVILSTAKRKVNVLAKEELFKNPIGNWFAKIFGIYPVNPEKKSMATLKISLKLLKNNELLMIFPEGTRNGMAKGVTPKSGAIKIAITAGVPIIPIGIRGTFKPFKKVIINIGKPIFYSDLKDIKDKEKLEEITEKLMKNIVDLRDNNICKERNDKK